MTLGLDELPTGQSAEIIELQQTGSIARRLAALGFVPGTQVSMVQNFGRGPIILSIINTRVALGRAEASVVRLRRSIS